MAITPWDSAAFECRPNGGVGDVQPVANAVQRLAVLVAGDGVDFVFAESPLFPDVGTRVAQDGEDAGFGELPLDGELFGGGSGVVCGSDLGARCAVR
ncbi:hypothetical protein [Nocardia sp. CA-120079]|uniref:hypothetical protein n=1 Tax=Nocardia sp. CA-120079 TaxID=3239974 RepID=UPI003D99F2E3